MGGLLLLGAGHAHVEVLRRFVRRPPPGPVTLVTPDAAAAYSGSIPGWLRGELAWEGAHVAVPPLAAAAGVGLHLDRAVAIDPVRRTVTLGGGEVLGFDVLSVDIGGETDAPAGAIGVKPIGAFAAGLPAAPDRAVVVGGGAGGTELVLALAVRWPGTRLTLVTPDGPLPGAPEAVRRIVSARLRRAGVALLTARVSPNGGGLTGLVIWATGVRGAGLLRASGMACDARGCVRVDAAMRSVSHPAVFAAGDCAASGLQKAGVWAVRAGAPLAANLSRAVRGEAVRAWRPQRRAVVILGLGNGRAVAWRGRRWVSGRSVAWVKRWVDAGWVAGRRW